MIRSSRLAARNAALALVLLAPSMAFGQDASPAAPSAGSPAAPQEQAPATAPKQDKPKSANENAQAVNPTRFGKPPEDDAFGAYQRGLYKTAYNLALPRAEAGDAAAQVLVAEILSRGLGVPFNPAEAAKWYGKAAEQGSPEAQFRYSAILLDGQYVAKDPAKARQLTEAAANAGNAAAQFNLGQMLMQEKPGSTGLDNAYPWFEKAAKKGLADAEYAVSQVLANGTPGIKRDEARARVFLISAAIKGHDTAQLDLGTWLVEGRGGKRDYKTGFGWMLRAATGGNVAAQARLAKLYRDGLGVEGDSVKAAAWYIVARRAGLNDPDLNSFLDGLDDSQMAAAISEANRLR
nr:tetratricopeptide repeat protein [Phyllobacterium sp. 0TCS1.6A]